MMSRDKLRQIKTMLRKDGHVPEAQQVMHALVDHGLEALDDMEGGKSVQEHRAELKERERQVNLALADLRVDLEKLAATAQDSMHPDCGDKALFTLSMVEEMLRAKGAAWKREWSYYTPRIEEEFGQ